MIDYRIVPDYIQEKYRSWKSDSTHGRKTWLNRAEESEEIYLNDIDGTASTFTSSQKKKIADSTNIPVSINFIHPITNQKLAILAQTKPSTKTIALDTRAKEEALVLDKMKSGIFNTTNASIEIEEHIKDMLISGIGHLMVIPGDFYQPGLFGLQITHIPYDEVVLDINAKKRDLSDMEGFFVEKQFTIAKALQLYGTIISQITDEAGNPVPIETFTGELMLENELTEKAKIITTNWNSDSSLRAREYYEKIYTKMYLIRNQETQLLEFFFAENLPEDARYILAEAEQVIEDIYIKKTIMLGEYQVAVETLGINDWPLISSFFEWGGKPYRSYGIPHFKKDMQKAFDKIMQTLILNGILSNNAGWTAPKGSITDEDKVKWQNFGNNPQVIKEFVPQEINGVLLKPEKEQVSQLSNFYPMVLDMLKNGIEYSSGINSIVQGNAGEAGVDVFSSLQTYQNAAMQRIMLSSNHINYSMKMLGEVLIQYIVLNITPDTFEFFDDDGNLNELEVALGMVNKIKQFKFQVVAIPGTYSPTQKLSTAIELMKIAQSSPDPAERSILTQKAMELSDVKEYDDVKEQLDLVKRTQSKYSNLEEAYNRLLETSKQMENKYINVSLENKILRKLSASEQEITKATEGAKADVKIAKETKIGKIKGEQKT